MRLKRLRTLTRETCASACALIFLGGTERLLVGPKARIGLHQAARTHEREDKTCEATRQDRSFRAMRSYLGWVDPAHAERLIDTIMRTPCTSIAFIAGEQALDLGVATRSSAEPGDLESRAAIDRTRPRGGFCSMADREDVEDARSRLRRFQAGHFKQFESEFRSLVERGQDPHALFIGCSDSRVVPHLLLGAEPGDLFVMRNVGAIVPPYGGAAARDRRGDRVRGARARRAPHRASARTRIAVRWRRSITRRRPAPRTSTGGSSTRARLCYRCRNPRTCCGGPSNAWSSSASSDCSATRWWPRPSRAATLRSTAGTT